MKEKTKQKLNRAVWTVIMIAMCALIYREAGIITAVIVFFLWMNFMRLTDVIQLQNEVLERVKSAMVGTLLVDKTLRDAAEEADREAEKGTEPT